MRSAILLFAIPFPVMVSSLALLQPPWLQWLDYATRKLGIDAVLLHICRTETKEALLGHNQPCRLRRTRQHTGIIKKAPMKTNCDK